MNGFITGLLWELALVGTVFLIGYLVWYFGEEQ